MFEKVAQYFNQNIGNGEYFELFGVKYYPYYKEKVFSEILKENYDYIIFGGIRLFGNRYADKAYYHKKILVGSLKPWDAYEYEMGLDKLSAGLIKDEYVYLVECYEQKDIRHLEKKNKISFIQIPENLNPFRIKRTEFKFFESLI